MESRPRIVQEYIALSDKNPFRSWFNSLKDRQAQYLIDTRLANVRRGTFGNCRLVGHGVFELKIHHGPGYRIYCGEDGLTVVILLCGGTKKTQNQDIKMAQQFWKDYKER